MFYRRQKQITEFSTLKKSVLIGLRAVSLFLIGVFLFGFIVEHKDYKTEKPVFISLIDNSSSMLNYRDSNEVETSIKAFDKQLRDEFGDRFHFENILVGKNVRSGKANFTASESNLNLGFNHIYEKYYNSNLGGVCFISDGNFNSGVSPVYSSKKIELTPIFSVGVGDTVVKRDQFIRNVAVNNVSFLKNKFPVDINIEAHRMNGDETKVSIWKAGVKVKEEKFRYEDNEINFKNILFELEAANVGFVEYEVKLEQVDNESSYENNIRKFYVEVIDSRSEILILSKSPHPDITAIKQELEKDENIEVDSKLISNWNGEAKDYSMVILHNPTSIEISISEKLQTSSIPVLYVLGGQTNSNFVEGAQLGLNYPRGQRLDEVQGVVTKGFQLFEVSDELKSGLQKWPPLSVRFGSISTSSGNVMISQKIGSVTKSDPIVYFGKRQAGKFGVVVGEGLWRWRMSNFIQNKDTKLFNELIQKTAQYLMVKKNNDPLRITLPKRYVVTKGVLINASFYNESFEQITTPSLKFKLLKDDGQTFNYEFAKINNAYKLSIGKLDPGRYSFEASTTHNGKFHRKKGVFVVEDISVESLSSRANHNVLNQIAKNSNGKFYTLKSVKSLIKDIANRKDIVNVTYEESSYDDLVDWKWLCVLLILLLGTEWFIRRQGGTY